MLSRKTIKTNWQLEHEKSTEQDSERQRVAGVQREDLSRLYEPKARPLGSQSIFNYKLSNNLRS